MDGFPHQQDIVRSLRDQLREASMPAHLRLENTVEAGGFLKSPQGYAAWLTIMQSFHAKLAAEYDQGSRRLGIGPPSDQLLQALADDTGRHITPQPKSSAFGPECIGVAYVFEGSAMGARLVRKQLASLPRAPMAYLNVLIETSHVRWPKIKTALTNLDAEAEPIVNRSVSLFDALSCAFSDARP